MGWNKQINTDIRLCLQFDSHKRNIIKAGLKKSVDILFFKAKRADNFSIYFTNSNS